MNMDVFDAISTFKEVVSYETLWSKPNETLKTISHLFQEHRTLPSELLKLSSDLFDEINQLRVEVEEFISKLNGFSVCMNGMFQYPDKLQSARYPVELFYYKGDIGLLESPMISIVGSRKCSETGIKRARKLAKGLVSKGYSIVSGLAKGIDTAAMVAAIDSRGNTVGVIGTPINQYYPKENQKLQERVAEDHLLISQVPFFRYAREPFQTKRRYFPQRNETMAALSDATIVVEASDTSGTLTQSRACLQQGKKLFILNSCFEKKDLRWPWEYEKKGAIRVKDFDTIFQALEKDIASNCHVEKF